MRPPETPSSAAVPTRATAFLRTFVPWQLFRFAAINLKMIRMILLSHRGPGRDGPGR
ncbi:MAG: hypothetical protein KGM24_08065 [Elusimicrobia bacterium]|nr:hypothetical protein [Elusimicrobiota bacterium]